MKSVLNCIKTFRIPNLLIVAILELVLHQHILVNTLNKYGITPALSAFHLGILIFFSIILTWSGYLINDIKDYEIDRINKAGVNQLDYLGGKKNAFRLYSVLTSISAGLAVYLAISLSKWSYIWMLPVIIFSLWYYSYKLKNHFFFGNVGVSILACLVILLVWLAENNRIALIPDINSTDYVCNIFLVYGIFAFLTSWARELIKDVEDIEGDKSNNIQTFPVRYGMKESMKYLVILLLVLLNIQCVVLYLNLASFHNFQILFAGFLLIFPVILQMSLAVKAKKKEDFTRMSLIMKLLMLCGILFLLTFN